jgi:hypothetical protein
MNNDGGGGATYFISKPPVIFTPCTIIVFYLPDNYIDVFIYYHLPAGQLACGILVLAIIKHPHSSHLGAL